MMKLKELLALLEIGWFTVIDRDTELRTEPLCDAGGSQLKTLRDKKVKSIRLSGWFIEIEVAAK